MANKVKLPQITGDGRKFADAVTKKLNEAIGADVSIIRQVTNISVEEIIRNGDQTNTIIDLVLRWSLPDTDTIGAKIYIQRNLATVSETPNADLDSTVGEWNTEWSLIGEGVTDFYYRNAIEGTTYKFKIAAIHRSRNTVSVETAPIVTYTSVGYTYSPDTPTRLQLTFDRSGISATWENSINVNTDYYELRENGNFGTEMGLLDRVRSPFSRFDISKPSYRSGSIYLYSRTTAGKYSAPCVVQYNKPVHPRPLNITIDKLFQSFTVNFDEIPDDCIGAVVQINGMQFQTINNYYSYLASSGTFIVKVAYYDTFGIGVWSDEHEIIMVERISAELLAAGSVTLDSVDEAIESALNRASIDTTILDSNIDEIISNLNLPPLNSPYGTIQNIRTTIDGIQTTITNISGNQDNVTAILNQLNLDPYDADPARRPTFISINQLTTNAQQTASTLSNFITTQTNTNNVLAGNISTVSQTANSINQTVVSLQGTVATNSSNITQRANSIEATLASAPNALGQYSAISQLHATSTAISNSINTINTNLSYRMDGLNNSITSIVQELEGTAENCNYSAITQLLNAVNLRVRSGDVINQINLDPSGILIDGANIHLTGNTLVDGDFIVSNIADNTLVGTKIKGGTITTDRIGANQIVTAHMAANSISGDRIQANTLNANRITAGSITSDRIAAGAITISNIASGAVGTAQLGSGVVALSNLNSDAQTTITSAATNASTALSTANTANSFIGTWRYADTTYINGGSIYTNTIHGNAITTGTLSASKIATGSIPIEALSSSLQSTINTASTSATSALNSTNLWRFPNSTYIDGGKIYTGSITANQIAAGTITANQIAAGSITSDRLRIGETTGARTEISHNLIKVYDANNALRVRIGVW